MSFTISELLVETLVRAGVKRILAAMLMGGLLSVAQHRLPIKMAIFNNSALALVELEMKAAGILENGTALVNPHFARLAEAVGVKGWRVEKPEELQDALRAAFAHPGPAALDVVVNRQELSIPRPFR